MKLYSKIILVSSACLLIIGCCGLFKSNDSKYKKEMECFYRITEPNAVRILKEGHFCCTALPKDIKTITEARRYYLLRAWGYKPDSYEAPLEIARSYAGEGLWFKALRYFDAARTRSHNNLRTVMGEITMYRLLGKYNEAYAWCRWLRTRKDYDGEKVADYFEARCLYDQGKYPEAEKLFLKATKESEKSGAYLGKTTYTIGPAWFYLAQIRLKAGDPLGAHERFKLFLKHFNDPDFQTYYGYWMPRLGKTQEAFYDKMEEDLIKYRY